LYAIKIKWNVICECKLQSDVIFFVFLFPGLENEDNKKQHYDFPFAIDRRVTCSVTELGECNLRVYENAFVTNIFTLRRNRKT